MAQINIRMDDNLKAKADLLFDELGMSMTVAFTVFIKQTLRERRIPFPIAANQSSLPPETGVEPTDIKEKLLSLAGTFDEEDYQDFMAAMKDCERVDVDEWSFD